MGTLLSRHASRNSWSLFSMACGLPMPSTSGTRQHRLREGCAAGHRGVPRGVAAMHRPKVRQSLFSRRRLLSDQAPQPIHSLGIFLEPVHVSAANVHAERRTLFLASQKRVIAPWPDCQLPARRSPWRASMRARNDRRRRGPRRASATSRRRPAVRRDPEDATPARRSHRSRLRCDNTARRLSPNCFRSPLANASSNIALASRPQNRS